MSEISSYKCSACGGILQFSSLKQKLVCVNCEAEYDVSEFDSAAAVDNKTDYSPREEQWNVEDEGLIAYECKNCGGEIVGDRNMGSTKCPFCDNPIVISSKFEGALKPDLMIPFKLDKKAATEKLREHVNRIKLAPGAFKSGNHIKEIQGVYVPFWLFDARVHAKGEYDARKENRHSDDKYEYVDTSYYDVMREGTMEFKNVPADASSKMADDLMDSIEPYNVEEAVPYSPAYMAGYLADRYDVPAEKCQPRADARMKTTAEDLLRSKVEGYNTVNTTKSDFKKLTQSHRYALYPVWILNTVWNGNKYVFAMNGQTGKLVGDVPYSKGMFFGILFGAFAIIEAILVGIIMASSGTIGSSGIIGSCVVSAIIAAIIAFVMKGKTTSVHKGTKAINFVTPGSFRVTNQYDNFIKKTTEKNPKQQKTN